LARCVCNLETIFAEGVENMRSTGDGGAWDRATSGVFRSAARPLAMMSLSKAGVGAVDRSCAQRLAARITVDVAFALAPNGATVNSQGRQPLGSPNKSVFEPRRGVTIASSNARCRPVRGLKRESTGPRSRGSRPWLINFAPSEALGPVLAASGLAPTRAETGGRRDPGRSGQHV
jgi:hypothetical protein